ncbi:MAG: AlpA family transcriptional regulator [Acidobacteria bacterium]|nr:AlpA family transcriptional regulator [Acidobacteriota bacterium]
MTIDDRFIRMPAVEEATGLSRSTIYRRVKAGTFPPPIPLGGPQAVGWLRSRVVRWMDEQVLAAGHELHAHPVEAG